MNAANQHNQSLNSGLHVRQLKKSYGSVEALKGVDIHVDDGEFVVLLGPNGAGKSTLFQLLSGLYSPDSGSIVIDGRDLTDHAIYGLARMGIVFQQITLDLDLTVKRNLLFHCDLHGVVDARKRIESELDRFGLSDTLNTPCRALSGGNRRKIELARSLLHSPSILMMDEATVGLDPGSRHALVNHVGSLCHENGLSVLWATHLVDEAADADRVYILDQGVLLEHGSPTDIVQRTKTETLLDAFLLLTEKTTISNNKADKQ